MNTYVATSLSLWLALCSFTAAAQSAPPIVGLSAQPTAGQTAASYDLAASRWIQKEKERAVNALAPMSVDALVVPFQVEGDSFDAVERSLLTRVVATELRVRAGLSVVPPTLAEQAFGSSARRIPEAAVLDLARRLHVRTVVRGFIGHDNHGSYHVRVESFSMGANGAPTDSRVVMDTRGVTFDDTHPPYFTFRAKSDELVDSIAARGTPARQVPTAASRPTMRVPSSIGELVQLGDKGPVERAYLLQFLAVLHPARVLDRARDALFERSLLALEGLRDSAETRTLRARAWAYLNRRPLALTVLKSANDEEIAMKAYLDGDLGTLSATVAKIGSPLAQLIATFELERLRVDYGRAADRTLSERLVKQYPYWAPVFAQTLDLIDSWSGHSNAAIKLALDAYWPIAKYDLMSALKAGAALDKTPTETEVSQLAFQHLDEATALHGAAAADDGLREADVIQLLREGLVANVAAQIRHIAQSIGRPQDAVTFARAYEAMLGDEPSFLIARGWAEFAASDRRPEPEKGALIASSYESFRRGAMYSQGQTDEDEQILTTFLQFFPGSRALTAGEVAQTFFDSDWPNRPGWGWRVPTSDAERERRLRQCIDYTIEGFQCLQELYDFQSRRDKAAAAMLVAANEHRFIGNPRRIDFLARVQREAGNDQAAVAILRKAIADKTPDWEPYRRLGTDLAKDGKPQEALEILLEYPGFKDPTIADRVALSNQAFEVGSLLYWGGAYTAARPLYKFAAALDTGSEASIASRSRLALLDGNFPAAMDDIVERARRYRSQYAVRDLVMFAGAFGDRDTAWAIFNSFEQQLHDQPEFWLGAFALHRMEGASLDAISRWAVQDDGRSKAHSDLDSLAMRHIFLTQVIDRDVDDTLATVLRQSDHGPPVVRGQSDRPTADGRPIPLAPFFADAPASSLPRPQPGQRIDSRLTMAAIALSAFARKDYERAFAVFEDLSRTYELREFLPYYAWASAQIGKTQPIERYLADMQRVKMNNGHLGTSANGSSFDDYLTLALLAGFKGDDDHALDYLAKANADVLQTVDRALLTRYQIAETAEMLLDRTHSKRYRDFLVDFARRNSVIDPVFSWPYAFVAKYGTDRSERVRALVRALFLDPQSRRALACDPKEIAEARKAMAAGNPFIGRVATL